jgi:hypothetical protein
MTIGNLLAEKVKRIKIKIKRKEICQNVVFPFSLLISFDSLFLLYIFCPRLLAGCVHIYL